MGYTHYFNFQKQDAKTHARVLRWKAVRNDFKKLYLKNSWGNLIQFESDIPEQYQFDMVDVRFNGVGENGHETFLLSRFANRNSENGEFCKTDRKDYDLPVTCLLLLFKMYYGSGFYFGSDGINNNGSLDILFLNAMETIERSLGYDLKIEATGQSLKTKNYVINNVSRKETKKLTVSK